MSYNFEQWPGKQGAERTKGTTTHVRFSRKQIYVSAKLMKLDPGKTADFDLMVDKEKRVFALKFKEGGWFALPSMPGQVCVTAFIAEYQPVINKRIHMQWDDDKKIWVGRLDGKNIIDKTQPLA
jgi:hypothetical protein